MITVELMDESTGECIAMAEWEAVPDVGERLSFGQGDYVVVHRGWGVNFRGSKAPVWNSQCVTLTLSREPVVTPCPNTNWNNNAIQFARLIAESEAIGLFSTHQSHELLANMDITIELLAELIDRATDVWDRIKSETVIPGSKTQITNICYLGERMTWEHGEYSGTITFPGEERGPTVIDWNEEELPDNWEEIEAIVEADAANYLCTQTN